MYKEISKMYDKLEWGSFCNMFWPTLENYIKKKEIDISTHLDVACGTGTLSLLMNQKKLCSDGIDSSKEMINIAKEKAKGLNINFYEADMRMFKLDKKYDLITCFSDSINHLLHLKDWKSTFCCVKQHLNNRGIFVFDCNSIKGYEETWNNFQFKKDNKGNYRIQKISYCKESNIVSLSFDVFVKRPDGFYELIEETILERTFSVVDITEGLKEAGFIDIEVLDGGMNEVEKPEQCHKLVFVCR